MRLQLLKVGYYRKNAIETHSLGPKNRVESENRIGFALRSRFDTVTGD